MDKEELTYYDFIDKLRSDIYKAFLNNKIAFHTYKTFKEMCNLLEVEYRDIRNAIN